MFRKITEEASLYDHLERKSTAEILVEINREDQQVATAVKEAIPQIERLVENIFQRLKSGGRVFYVACWMLLRFLQPMDFRTFLLR